MSGFNISRTRKLLQEFDFNGVFVEELGWEQPAKLMSDKLLCDGQHYERTPVASLSGVMVFELLADDGKMPDGKARLAVEKQISQHYNKNLLIFVNTQRTHSVWYWVKREENKRYPRSHDYVRGQSGDLFLSKIGAMFVDISSLTEEGNVPVARVAQSMKDALDIERVTKKFYNDFQEEYQRFLDYISGIEDESERRWYVSVILNRLMFVYFLQSKGFIDHGDLRYLQNKLDESQTRGPERYYDEFLEALFFEGFANPPQKRSPSAQELLGEVKYLNGGLFLRHPIEKRWPDIAIPDVAFEQLFALFERYSWQLDDTLGGRDDEINPDVLGYIFEKYINQKAFGAYYTRPEITQYLCEQTIHQLVLDKLAELSVPIPGLPALPVIGSIGDLWSKMDNTQCRLLLQEVLPKLSLLDPACGSGAFLVAAMKTLFDLYRPALMWAGSASCTNVALQQWLAEVDRDHPSRDYFIKKQIITNNLFGVDIMEEAVEIARLRLFLALVSSVQSAHQLEPLPNIDFNILPGNSLFGLLRVSQTTYNGRLGDAPYATLVAKKNQLVQQYRGATEIKELKHNPIALTALRQTIEEHRERANQVLNGILLDEFRQLKIKVEQVTWDTKKNKKGKSQKRALTRADIDALRPFHWGYEFDEVMNVRGGFDAIITNPPWEIFKPQAKEFFADYSDVVTKNKMTIKTFKKKQKELLRQADIREAWLDYLSRFPHQSNYFRKSYQHQRAIVNGRKTGSDINLYKLFLERCYHLLREDAPCGIVIPSGIYTDLGATGLRQMLFSQTQIRGLFGFENRKKIFEGVDSRFKFIVLTFSKGGETQQFPATFMRKDVAELAQFPDNAQMMSLDLVRRLSPEILSLMEFGDEIDIQIAEKMTRFPILGQEIEGVWKFLLNNEFHMRNDSHLFKTEDGEGSLPLLTGKMFHQFRLTDKHSGYWIDESDGRNRLLGKKTKDNGQPLDYQGYRWVHRRIARNTDSRTLITTITPKNVLTEVNSTTIKVLETGITSSEMLFLCAITNSFVLDWYIRQKVTTTLNMFYIYQLPVPRLTAQDSAFAPIVERAAKLICTTPAFDELAHEVGLAGHKEGVTNEVQRNKLRAELDGYVAHLYNLTEQEFVYILKTFPLVPEPYKVATQNAYRDIERGVLL